ncbi:glycosyltransferase family 2 protein [Marinobacter sp. X15-166B]|uniref:glycosyltransferase family 2 protein n=1 Tax=Marinobacter sp. X15-166B TaxID=1897620 RepID=UPI00085C90B8|nr:glycosyltransferase family 2 protein [Marinobacter sp. X15-166B]OEY67758.1 glycosyl transferase [Marinobacter sp. X15-166B]
MLYIIFWLSLLVLLYVYIGYPLLVWAIAQTSRKPFHSGVEPAATPPFVSILIAAHNEARDIEATLTNKMALDYPTDRLEVLVISDDSDDGTDDLIEGLAKTSPVPIRLYRQTPRQGKTAGLNTLVSEAEGDILLFSDANSRWDAQVVRHLVKRFADPAVGYVTGTMVYVNKDGSLVGDGCSAYMKYENWLRTQESAIGSVVGVDGGIDAMRKSLYQPMGADQLPDFVQPLKVVEQGARVVYEPAALLKEDTLTDGGSEFSMRVRVSLRALWALWDMKHLMNPLSYNLFAVQLISHKLLRYSAFIPLLVFSLAALLLAGRGGIYTLSFLGVVALYALGWMGKVKQQEGKKSSIFFSVPYYFLLLNLASLKAAVAFLKGEKRVVWNPRKG